MWAAMAGPYQSPALFPESLPNSTSRCRPNGAEGRSPNQDTILLWVRSSWVSLSTAVPRLRLRGFPESRRLSLRESSSMWASTTSRSSLVWWCVAGQVQPEESQYRPEEWRSYFCTEYAVSNCASNVQLKITAFYVNMMCVCVYIYIYCIY